MLASLNVGDKPWVCSIGTAGVLARALMATMVVGLAGCGGGRPLEPASSRRIDLFETEAAALRDAGAIAIRSGAFDVSVAGDNAGHTWFPTRPADPFALTSDGLDFETTDEQSGIAYRVEMDASRAAALEFEARITGANPVKFVAAWSPGSGAGGGVSDAIDAGAFAKADVHVPADGSWNTITIRLADSPAWAGRIDTFYLVPKVRGRHAHVTLRHIRLLEPSLTDYLIRRPGEPFCRARIENETRPVLRSTSALEKEVEVPRHATFRVGAGVLDPAWRHEGSVRFSARALDSRGKEIGAVKREIEVAPHLAQVGWQELWMDLGDVAGERVTISLEAHVDGEGARSILPFAVWAVPRICSPVVPNAPPINVVLVSLDTLRADHVSAYGNPAPTSPTINLLAREGALAAAAISQAPETFPSHRSLMTGTYVSRHLGTSFFGSRQKTALPTLAGAFRRAGYETEAVTEGGGVSSHYGFDIGFDSYDDGPQRNPHGSRREDFCFVERTFDKAIDFVRDQRDHPFFLFVHTYEIHAPYWPESPLESIFAAAGYVGRFARVFAKGEDSDAELTEADMRQIQSLYDAGIRSADRHLGQLVDTIHQLGLASRTLIVVLADHGEEFGDHVAFARHGITLYDEMIHVPLVFRLPGVVTTGAILKGPVGLIDVFPTVLDLAGLRDDDATCFVEGISLAPYLCGSRSPEDRVVFSEDYTEFTRVSARTRDRKEILSATASAGLLPNSNFCSRLRPDELRRLGKPFEVFDLVGDPGERWNRAPEDPGSLRDDVQAFRRSHVRGVVFELPTSREATVVTGVIRGLPRHAPVIVPWLSDGDVADATDAGLRFRIGVAPGSHHLIALPPGDHASFEMRLEVDGRPLTVRDINGGRAVAASDESWIRCNVRSLAPFPQDPDESGRCRVTLRSASFDVYGSDETVDQATQDQLRLLGYTQDDGGR